MLDYTTIQLSKWTADAHKNEMIHDLVINFLKKYKEVDAELKRKKFAITIGDELPSGIIQMAKVYIAKKRKIGVGDKMAGRHGNKGIGLECKRPIPQSLSCVLWCHWLRPANHCPNILSAPYGPNSFLNLSH